MKKGFTLIELLAVIVILAIIALIATPTILNIIDGVGKSSAEASMESIDRAVNLHYSKKQLTGTVQKEIFVCLNGECKNGIELLELDAKGIEGGVITIYPDGSVEYSSIIINGYVFNKPRENKEVIKGGSATLVTSEISNGGKIVTSKSSTISNYKISGNGLGNLDSTTGKYIIPITISGKNLFNINADFSDSQIYYSGNGYYGHKYELKPNINYTISLANNLKTEYVTLTVGSYHGQTDVITHWISHKTSEYISLLPNSKKTFLTGNSGFVWLNTTNGGTAQAFKNAINECFDDLQLEEGTVATEYEPYVEPRNYNIILSRQLKEGEYIDFSRQAVINGNGEIVTDIEITLPQIELHEKTNVITLSTTTTPSKIEVTYIK